MLGVELDVVKGTVMLRCGWLVLQGRMEFGVVKSIVAGEDGVGCRVGRG